MGKILPELYLEEFMSLPRKIRIKISFQSLMQAITDQRIAKCYEESFRRQLEAKRRYEKTYKRKTNKKCCPKN